MMAPVGGSTSAKMLLQLPKEVQDIAVSANTLVRGNFAAQLAYRLGLLSTIAGPEHLRTRMFIANITAASMADGGAASENFLQGIVNMLYVNPPSRAGRRSMTPGMFQRGGDNDKGANDGHE